ncbi:hypothetical protein [Sphingomonas sp. 2R-10]|uniref:hypothetical protein n=1 Tax=Sphingomonas sp. 2R-10 TaxID=3045148 RepID=UPI0013DE389E|nr:hypothetical protein [Sphingomonas sp. 2R-10]
MRGRRAFPEWHGRIPAAIARFRAETDHGRRRWARSDVMVSSEADAVHRRVFLPLIRTELNAAPPP